MVADFSNGVPVMCIARNIGAWLSHSNTLSVLDCTILVPVRSTRIREGLTSIFSKQIAILGYGKEVSTQLNCFLNLSRLQRLTRMMSSIDRFMVCLKL